MGFRKTRRRTKKRGGAATDDSITPVCCINLEKKISGLEQKITRMSATGQSSTARQSSTAEARTYITDDSITMPSNSSMFNVYKRYEMGPIRNPRTTNSGPKINVRYTDTFKLRQLKKPTGDQPIGSIWHMADSDEYSVEKLFELRHSQYSPIHPVKEGNSKYSFRIMGNDSNTEKQDSYYIVIEELSAGGGGGKRRKTRRRRNKKKKAKKSHRRRR